MCDDETKRYFKDLHKKLDKVILHQEGLRKDSIQNTKEHKGILSHIEKMDIRTSKLEDFKSKIIGMAILIIGSGGIVTAVFSIIK